MHLGRGARVHPNQETEGGQTSTSTRWGVHLISDTLTSDEHTAQSRFHGGGGRVRDKISGHVAGGGGERTTMGKTKERRRPRQRSDNDHQQQCRVFSLVSTDDIHGANNRSGGRADRDARAGGVAAIEQRSKRDHGVSNIQTHKIQQTGR
jgi:hypothetical protein